MKRQASPAPDGPGAPSPGPAVTRTRRPRVLGIDPGQKIGIAVLDIGSHQASTVHLSTWDASEEDRLEGLLDGVLALGPDLVSIERVVHVHGLSDGEKGRNRAGASLATGLARGNWIGGLLAGLVTSAGIRVVTTDAGTWRSALVGTRSATNNEIARMIRLRVPDWPAVSNEHQRDAAGCALWAGLALNQARRTG